MRGPIQALRLGPRGPLVHIALLRPVAVTGASRQGLAAVIGDLAGRFGEPSVPAASLMPDRRAPLGLGPLTTDAMGVDYLDETTRDLTIVRAVSGIQRGRASATLSAELRASAARTELEGRLILSPECRFGTELAIAVFLVAALWAIAETVVGAAVLALFAAAFMVASWYAAASSANELLSDLADVLGDEPVVGRRGRR